MPSESVIRVPLEVRFRDLDAMGHVNNAVYLTYFEEARKHLFLRINKYTEGALFSFIVAHIGCDYHKPITLSDPLLVELQVGKIGRKSFHLHYKLLPRAGAEADYATGVSVQVCYDYQAQKTVPVADGLAKHLRQFSPNTEG